MGSKADRQTVVYVLGAQFVQEARSVGGDAERSRVASFVRSGSRMLFLGARPG